MEISNLDITLARIRQIEARISQLDGNLANLGTDVENNVPSFDVIFNDKLQGDSKGSVKINNEEIKDLVEKYSEQNGLDDKLVAAVINQESGFNPKAISRAGAQGLMQLMPGTARGLGVEDPFDPEQNIAGGTKYLKNLINKYDSVELGLAAYNAGSGAVNKYKGIPPYRETQNYVKNIMQHVK